MTMQGPFSPARGSGFTVPPNTGGFSYGILDGAAKSVRITNLSPTSTMFVNIGIGEFPDLAPTSGTPVLPLTSIILAKNDGDTSIGVHSSGAGGGFCIQVGEGGLL